MLWAGSSRWHGGGPGPGDVNATAFCGDVINWAPIRANAIGSRIRARIPRSVFPRALPSGFPPIRKPFVHSRHQRTPDQRARAEAKLCLGSRAVWSGGDINYGDENTVEPDSAAPR